MVCSCKYSQSKWQMFQLYIILDNILIALITAIVGYVGIVLLLYSAIMNNLIITEIVCLCFVFVTYTGNYRVILANCSFTKSKLIISKVSLLLGCAGYLILGAYFMSVNLPDQDTNSN